MGKMLRCWIVLWYSTLFLLNSLIEHSGEYTLIEESIHTYDCFNRSLIEHSLSSNGTLLHHQYIIVNRHFYAFLISSVCQSPVGELP